MKKMIFLLAALLLFCGGCQAMKRMLNNEPRKRPVRSRPAQAATPREVFPGSRSSSRPPSMLDSELSAGEREAMKSLKKENRFPERDYNKIRREDKAASDWVFGR